MIGEIWRQGSMDAHPLVESPPRLMSIWLVHDMVTTSPHVHATTQPRPPQPLPAAPWDA